jgi:hypothetical protein
MMTKRISESLPPVFVGLLLRLIFDREGGGSLQTTRHYNPEDRIQYNDTPIF